jgi:DNA invertase Pin-like site-specific DNA recombinase
MAALARRVHLNGQGGKQMPSKTNQTKRVGLYVRVSTSEQSSNMQLAELKEFAQARGWTVAGVYQDDGFSGKNTKRPELQRLLADASRRRFDAVLVWKLDRFARSLGDLIAMIQGLAEVGVDFVSLRDSLDLTTSQGRLMLHLLGAFAQFERDLIATRVQAGLEAARRRGQRLGRPKTRDDASIRQLRSEGHSLRAIAARLGVSKGAVQSALAGWTKNPSKSGSASA